MKIKLNKAYSFNQLGQRGNQEDSRYPDADVLPSGQRFFVVCDGVGGSEKGEVASSTVCRAFGEALDKVDLSEGRFNDETVADLLNRGYEALDQVADESNKGMATTMTIVIFDGEGAVMAHIGDSRIYHIRPKYEVLYRSEDHSLVNALVRSGVITPEEAVDHPKSNVITRFMGPTEEGRQRCKATVRRTEDIRPGDYFFLCSDGVLHCVTDEELEAICSEDITDEEKIKKIAAQSFNSVDNNTAILVSVASVEDEEDYRIEETETSGGTIGEETPTVSTRRPDTGSSEVAPASSSSARKGFFARLKRIFG